MALPTPPPEMSRGDETGAVAAATYFVTEIYPYTYVSQDTAPLMAVSHEKCIFCASVLAAVAEERAAGRSTRPGAMTLNAVTAELINAIEFQVTIDMSQTVDTVWSSTGDLLGSDGPHQTTLAVFVIWDNHRWVLRGVDALRVDGKLQ
jgi:hypothetical protein